MAKADIELLFGVLGGGSVSGKSGANIKGDLDSIVSAINKDPYKIEIELDKGSITSFETQLKNLTKTAQEQAQAIKDAYKGINPTISSGQSGSRRSSSIKSSSLIGVDTAEMQKSIAILMEYRSKIDKLMSGFGATAAGSGTKTYDELKQINSILKVYEGLVAQGCVRNDAFAADMEYIAAAVRKAKAELDLLGKSKNSIDFKAGSEANVKALVELSKAISTTKKNYESWTAAAKGDTEGDYRGLKSAIDSFEQLHEEVKSGTITFEEYKNRFANIKRDADQYSASIKAAGKDTRSLGDQVKDLAVKFSKWLSISQIVMRSIRTIRQMADTVVEIDTAMTELRKVTDETEVVYDRFLANSITRAKALGATLTDVVKASADFAKLGKSIQEASDLADAAIVYKNVGDNISDISTAAESIISTMQAFSDEGLEAMEIVDRFNIVGNRFAITSTGVGDALQRSAAAMNAAGNSLDETIALVAAANTIVQNPDSVGTTLKTVSMYLRAAKTEAEEAGESTEGMASSMSELRNEILKLTGNKVDIQIDENNFKSTYQILKELSAEWDKLTDISKANILEMIGGKRNANVVSSLLESFEIAERALETSANSAGSALAENEKYLDSVQGKIQKFQAAWQALSSSLISSDLTKIVVDVARLFVEGITWMTDTLGGLSLAIGAVPLTVFISKLKPVAEVINTLKLAWKDFAGVFKQASPLLTATNEAERALAAQRMISRGIIEQSALAMTGANKKVIEYISSLGVATAADLTFGQSVKITTMCLLEQAKAWALSPLGMATVAAAGVYALVKIVNYFNEAIDRSRENLDNLKNEYNNNESELKSLEGELQTTSERISELQSKGKLSFTEQEELSRLQAQNAELERSIHLLEAEQKLLAKEKSEAFVDVAEQSMGRTWGNTEYSQYDNLNNYLDTYTRLQDELARLEQEKATAVGRAMDNGWTDGAEIFEKYYSKQIDDVKSRMADTLGYLKDQYQNYKSDMEGVSLFPDVEADKNGSIEAQSNYWLGLYRDFQDKFMIATGGVNAKSDAFIRLINESYADATKGLRDLGKEGKVTADTLNDPAYAEFVQKCIEIGIISDSSTDSLNFLATGFNNLNASAESSVGVVEGVVNSYAKIAESVSGLKSELETINSAISEQGYTGSITPESYDALIAVSSDYAQCIEYQNGALQVNTEKANALFEAKSKLQIAEIELQKLDEVSRWRENAAAIEELESQYDSLTDAQLSELDNLRKENAAIELNIQGYNVQIAAIEDLTSAYTKWKNASEANNSDSMYGDMASALEDIRAAMESGKTGIGNVVYQAAVELLVPDRQNVADYMATLERYITEDASGLNNFVTDMLSEGLMTQVGDKVEMVAGTTIDQICEKMTITPEMARSMFNALEMYEGWDFDWTESGFGIEETGAALSGVQENLGVMSETLDGVSEKVLGTFGAEATLDILGDVQSVLQRIENFRFSTKYLNVVQTTTGSYTPTDSQKSSSAYWSQFYADGTKHAEDGPALLGDEYSSDGSPRPEMVITDGAAYIAGLNGPEIVNLSEGDQVLTYDQTKRVLSGNPKVRKSLMPAFATGAGGYAAGSLAEQMYLDGKIKAVSTPSSSTSYKPNLYTTNVVPNTGGVKTNNYTVPNYAKSQAGTAVSGGGTQSSVSSSVSKPSGSSGGGSGGSSSSGSSSSSSPSSKQKKSQFEKDYEYHQHLLAMEQESYENYIDWLENAYKDAYEKGQIELEDFYRYEEEVFEGRKELFQDALEDIEHKIASLEREPGNESKIINYYNQLISMVDNQLAEARARGLNDDDEYIQELLEQKWDYADEIKDIQEEITENAMDAVDDLVEYRIDMLKQDIENEKDALNDKLGALKDFYDEQKQMLQDVYDEEKYLEEQAEKRKSVDDIRAEMDMLKFDDSAKAQKRMLELQEELLEAEKELSDFEKDHALETTTDLLDKMYEMQESQIQSEIDALDARLNDPDALYNQALRDIQNNTLALYEEMLEYNNKYGDGNDQTIFDMWDAADKSLDAYLKAFGQAYKNILLVDAYKPTGYASGTSRATAGVHEVFEGNKDEYVLQTSDGRRYKMFSGLGDKVLNASATDFLYKFANNGESFLSKIMGGLVGNISNVNRRVQPVSIKTGDIMISGNADSRTVSEIRRAQRDNVDHILREFIKLNR